MTKGNALGEEAHKPCEPSKEETNTHIRKLQKKQNIIRKKQSSVRLLVARYNVDNSFIDDAAKWYVELSWWKKAVGLLLGTIQTLLVGLASPLGAVAMIFCNVVGILSHFVLSNHYATGDKRVSRMKEDVVALEADLTEIVEELRELESGFADVLEQLKVQEQRLADVVENYESELEALNEQIENLEKSSVTFNEEKESLLSEIEGLKTQLSEAKEALSGASTTIEAKVSMLEQTQLELAEAKELLDENGKKLLKVEAEYSARVDNLKELEGVLTEGLAPILAIKAQKEVEEAEDDFKSVEYYRQQAAASRERSLQTQANIAQTDAFLASLGIVIDDKNIDKDDTAPKPF